MQKDKPIDINIREHQGRNIVEFRDGPFTAYLTRSFADHYISLTKRIAELEGSISVAANKFREYEFLHLAKGTPEAKKKANANAKMAEMLEKALRGEG